MPSRRLHPNGTDHTPTLDVLQKRQTFLAEMFAEVTLEDWHAMVRAVVDKIKATGDAKLFGIMSTYLMGLPPRPDGDDVLEKQTLRIVIEDGRVGVESATETKRLSEPHGG